MLVTYNMHIVPLNRLGLHAGVGPGAVVPQGPMPTSSSEASMHEVAALAAAAANPNLQVGEFLASLGLSGSAGSAALTSLAQKLAAAGAFSGQAPR